MKLLLLSLCFAAALALPLTLPGYNGPSLSMDSGYIKSADSRHLFYILTRSIQTPSKDAPLIFWFQGGPGCSGLGGFFTEHGPVGVGPNGNLTYRSINWAQKANMVWFEQPAGVGFSYSDDSYTPSDTQSQGDNFNFIQGFLKAFPEFANNDIYLTGESYGGVYVPMASDMIVNTPNSQAAKQFKGFAVGNPVFRCTKLDGDSDAVDMLYFHGLVSYTIFNQWNQACRPLAPSNRPQSCQTTLATMFQQVGQIDQQLRSAPQQPSLDPDSLYQDFVKGNGTLDFALSVPGPNNPPPIGQLVNNYLSRSDVQTALHVAPAAFGRKWQECNMEVNAQYDANGGPINQYYENILQKSPSTRVFVYSGDVDIATVPFADTKFCLAQLPSQSNTKPWGPWRVNGATAGYWETFNAGGNGGAYTYATIKGAGHEAPEFQPYTSYQMMYRWLFNGGDLAETSSNSFQAPEPLVNQARALHKLRARA